LKKLRKRGGEKNNVQVSTTIWSYWSISKNNGNPPCMLVVSLYSSRNNTSTRAKKEDATLEEGWKNENNL